MLTPDELAAIQTRSDTAAYHPDPVGIAYAASASDVPALLAEIARLRTGIAALPAYEHVAGGNGQCRKNMLSKGRWLECDCGADEANAQLRALVGDAPDG